ncbi:unnamed protein product, partial [Vitis vinifera]
MMMILKEKHEFVVHQVDLLNQTTITMKNGKLGPPSAWTVLLIMRKRKMNMTKWLLAGKRLVNACI